jgi:hypothetical protein
MFYPFNTPSFIAAMFFAAPCNLDYHPHLLSFKYLKRKQQCRFGTTAFRSLLMLNQAPWAATHGTLNFTKL